MRTFSFSSALAITAAMSLSGSSWAQGDMALAFSQMGMGALPAPWHFVTLPGKNPTSFTVTDLDGQNVLKVAIWQYGSHPAPAPFSQSSAAMALAR